LTLSGGGFRAEYFQGLAELEAGNFWFQARNKLIIWALRRFFPDLCRFLEIGCGTGFVLSGVAAAFPTAELTGSEIFSAGLPHATSRVPRAELLQMDARVIPYVEHFDVVGAFDVLEHIVEDEQVLRQIYKTLRPAGGIVLTVPQHPWLWSRQDQLACHVRRYTDAELRFKVAEAGFTVIYDSSFVSLLLPFLWISRRLGQTAEDADPLAELRTSRLTNRFLSSAMTAERLLIRLGVRFSAGGSLLLVARRG
jgi:SAM-dependent methyltransferase